MPAGAFSAASSCSLKASVAAGVATCSAVMTRQLRTLAASWRCLTLSYGLGYGDGRQSSLKAGRKTTVFRTLACASKNAVISEGGMGGFQMGFLYSRLGINSGHT